MYHTRRHSISLANLPQNHFYLEENIFVVVVESYDDIVIQIQKFDSYNNIFYPSGKLITLKPITWYQLSCDMENELNDFYVIPEELFIHRKKGCYFLQKCFVRKNYYSFVKERCYLTESQWQNLKKNRIIIHFHIVKEMFGTLFTKHLCDFGMMTPRYSDNILHFFILSFMKKELSKYKASNNAELWQKYFYVVVFNADIKILAKQFWETNKYTLSTINIVKELFENVYKMFIAS